MRFQKSVISSLVLYFINSFPLCGEMDPNFVVVDKPGICVHEYRNEYLWQALSLEIKKLCCYHSSTCDQQFLRNAAVFKISPGDLLVRAFKLKSFPAHRVCNFCFYNRAAEKNCMCLFFVLVHYEDYVYPGNWLRRSSIGTVPLKTLCCKGNHENNSNSVSIYYQFEQIPSHKLCQECYVKTLREDRFEKTCNCQYRLQENE